MPFTPAWITVTGRPFYLVLPLHPMDSFHIQPRSFKYFGGGFFENTTTMYFFLTMDMSWDFGGFVVWLLIWLDCFQHIYTIQYVTVYDTALKLLGFIKMY